jgi:hypothetical protein
VRWRRPPDERLPLRDPWPPREGFPPLPRRGDRWPAWIR